MPRNISPSKIIYWNLIDRFTKSKNALCIMWQMDLNIVLTEDRWEKIFVNFIKIVKPVKLQYFQYRLMRRILTTNVKRAKWDTSITEACTFCQKHKETVLHLLCECEKVHSLWGALSRVIKYYYDVNVVFTKELIILNEYTGKAKIVINLFIVIMKQYIYATKCLNEALNFNGFMYRINYWYQIDKWHHLQNGYSVVALNKKWKEII